MSCDSSENESMKVQSEECLCFINITSGNVDILYHQSYRSCSIFTTNTRKKRNGKGLDDVCFSFFPISEIQYFFRTCFYYPLSHHTFYAFRFCLCLSLSLVFVLSLSLPLKRNFCCCCYYCLIPLNQCEFNQIHVMIAELTH